MPTKKKTAVKKKSIVASTTHEPDLVVKTETGSAFVELKTPSLGAQLQRIKKTASEYSPKVQQLKNRWFALQNEINQIDGLVPMVVSEKSEEHDDLYAHLGIRRLKNDRWYLVGGHIDLANVEPGHLTFVDELSLRDMFYCLRLIDALLERVREHIYNRAAELDIVIEDFDEKMIELDIDLSEHLEEEDN